MSNADDNKITLEDNSDRPMSESENKEVPAQKDEGGKEEAPQTKEDGKSHRIVLGHRSSPGAPSHTFARLTHLFLHLAAGPWYGKPEEMGNNFGGKVGNVLSPVGKHAGPVLEKGAGPVGAIVDPLVGGVMKSGKGFGETLGVGYGNAEGGPAKAQEAEHARMKEQFGGKEQTGDNPLGL